MAERKTPDEPNERPLDQRDRDRATEGMDAGPTSGERPYEVGYGKPPREHRFKPGQSGNPTGRPKGSRNLATAVRKALDQRVPVREDGRYRKRSATEVIAQQVVRKAMTGDLRAAQWLLQLSQTEAVRSEADPPEGELSSEDVAILTDFLARHDRDGGGGADGQ